MLQRGGGAHHGQIRNRGTRKHSSSSLQSITHLYQLSCSKMASPADSCTPRNVSAWNGVTAPEASGRDRVLSAGVPGGQRTKRQKDLEYESRITSLDAPPQTHTDMGVELTVPHVIDGAPSAPHDERSRTKEERVPCQCARR